VRPDRILLVNHPKAYAGELAIQIVEHFGYGRTTRLNVIPLIRVGQQRAWNVNIHSIGSDRDRGLRLVETDLAPAWKPDFGNCFA